jgi:hypothetical protein
MVRISRPCYDKFHRCPGWNGGGPHYAKVSRCDGGSLGAAYEKRAWKWRFHRCPKCRVWVFPYVTRYLSIPLLFHEIKWRISNAL